MDWLAGRAQAQSRTRRRGRRAWGRRALPDPAGGRGWKMAELRALVAVKRVIDFAVKVTGPPSPTSPCPAAVCFRGHEHTLYGGGGVLVTSDLCPLLPHTRKRQSHT